MIPMCKSVIFTKKSHLRIVYTEYLKLLILNQINDPFKHIRNLYD